MGAACCAGAAMVGSAPPTTLLDGTIYSFLSAIPIALYHYYPQITIVLATLLVLGASSFYLVLILLTPEQKQSSPSELTFLSTESKEPQMLPKLLDEEDKEGLNGAVQLSVVVPAYNEKERLPVMLKETIEFLESLKKQKRSLVQGLERGSSPNGKANGVLNGSTARPNSITTSVHSALHQPLTSYEILIVDDGSRDNTHQIALDFAEEHDTPSVRVIRLVKNRGKGGAVRHGVLHSRGSLILFADADGATCFADLTQLCETLSAVVTAKGHGVAVGSRAHMVKSDAVVKRSFIRNLLMHGFHLFLTLLLRPPTLGGLLRKLTGRNGKQKGPSGAKCGFKRVALPIQPEIKDTQCGFKLFTRPTARLVFPTSHIDGWIFDVELLMLAQTSSQLALESILPASAPSTPCLASTSDLGNDNYNQSQLPEKSLERLKGLPIPIAEVAVHWQEIGGSKIDLVKDSIRMALDLIVIRANYGLTRWEKPPPAL
ncbi:related to dolichyl-phosphate beta-glucosyltransferase [Melanopsichium pennsylvanicum]|uniref:dolichyl-phosphate beta-glucosyltransferase n=2 Tax=Melanopsichium pennsylvanicum TaxID=63383 RepID=A0AAJ5C3M6_9BASI|nr:related to dolichyl-phosphate beta-glucosyltransferase [Melanopsichium pennsylvanicum 4]SNX82619.1 related to dolichyl-phosphate beta-glucosyltransferase [Melanopsichium pennsylvanicum]